MIISRFKPDGRSRQGLGRGGQDNVYGYCIYTRVYNVRECPEPLTIFARANFTTAISNTARPLFVCPLPPTAPIRHTKQPFPRSDRRRGVIVRQGRMVHRRRCVPILCTCYITGRRLMAIITPYLLLLF